MRCTMVRYRVKADRVAENEALVRDVFAELERTQPPGFRYMTFRHEDGATFMHVVVADPGREETLLELPAFDRFREGIRDRCAEPPAVSDLTAVGVHGLAP